MGTRARRIEIQVARPLEISGYENCDIVTDIVKVWFDSELILGIHPLCNRVMQG